MSQNPRNPRDYGLGDYTRYNIGRPHLVEIHDKEIEEVPPECPRCKIRVLCGIEIVMEGLPLVPTQYALGQYLGCPACPWASPMMVMPINELPNWFKEQS